MAENLSFEAEEILGQIGRRLRAAREAKGLAIQDIANRTKIAATSLEKIEAGDIKNLPGLAFVRGFVRNYLQALELEDEEIEAGLKKFGGLDQFARETDLAPKIRDFYEFDEPRHPIRPILIGLAVILVLWGGYTVFSFFSEPASTPGQASLPTGPPEVAGTAASAPDVTPAAILEPQPTPVTVRQVSKLLPLDTQQLLKLTVRGLEPTWVRVAIDRAPPFDVRLEPAETLEWEANEEIRLTVGRSNGVAVYLNGEDILLPTERNRLITGIVLNKLTLLRLEN